MSRSVNGDDPSTEGPWRPGLRSPVPHDIEPLTTLYDPRHSFTSIEQIRDLAEFTGMARDQLVVFRPERLITHELLVRVASDVSVPDGPDSEDLGVNFRRIVRTIDEHYLAPHLDTLRAAYDELDHRISTTVNDRLVDWMQSRPATRGSTPAQAVKPDVRPIRSSIRSALDRLTRWWSSHPGQGNGLCDSAQSSNSKTEPSEASRRSSNPGAQQNDSAWETRAIATWRAIARAGDCSAEEVVVARNLALILSAIRARHGRIVGDARLLGSVIAGKCCNELGSELLGNLIAPLVDNAIDAEGYRRLPAQKRPVVMNTKGASASGKSSQRPRQRVLAERIGVEWPDFALISPDIFRKYLLDYESLGEAYKYAGMLTGEELGIVDQKLDRYVAEKAKRGNMSHLLIDRFRFDSFAPESTEQGSNLLTRFGDEVYLFFLVTSPHLTVDRAWERGLRVGRYKTVDDLLFHNVEAFTGMPDLFFTWALDESKQVHYEFLDNDGAQNSPPTTIAFGANGRLVILEPNGLLNVERFRKINIGARQPNEVYPPDAEMAPERNSQFLRACVTRLPQVELADPATGQVVLRFEQGQPVAVAGDPSTTMSANIDLLLSGSKSDLPNGLASIDTSTRLDRRQTLGA